MRIIEKFEKNMSEHDEVKQCYFISGEIDYLLMVHVANLEEYNTFARQVLVSSPNIQGFRSHFCLSRIKYETNILLNEN